MLLDPDRMALISKNLSQGAQSLKILPEAQQQALFTRQFNATAHQTSNFQISVETEGHAVQFDQQPRNGGDAAAPCPVSMLLASLAACLEMSWVLMLSLSQTRVEFVKVQISGSLDGRYGFGGKTAPPARLTAVEITSILKTTEPRAKLERLLEKAVAACPVGGSLHEQIQKSYRLEIV